MKFGLYRVLAAIVLAVAGAVLLIAVRPLAVDAIYPMTKARQFLSRRLWPRVTGVFRASSANAENVRLRRELATLSVMRTDLERLEDENARLRSALGYVARNPGTWIAAGVLSSEGGASAVRKTIRVDKGISAGVRKGALVVVPEGLVGRVSAVSMKTSEILLLTDSSLYVACDIEGGVDRVARGILSGGTPELLTMKYLWGAEGLPPRSRVITSGAGGVFPRGLEVGVYLGNGEVLPTVNFSNLEDVFIRSEK